MATFRCKRSGNTISFTNESDIAGLRNHEGYEEVKSQSDVLSELKDVIDEVKQESSPKIVIAKPKGRPKKK